MLAYRVKMLTTDRLMDMKMGVSTSYIFQQADPVAALHASPSQPVAFQEISLSLKALPRDRPAQFVDIGCGVGRACFFAAYYGEFSNVIGMDFNAALIDLARENSSRFDNRNSATLDFQVGDAREYRLPDSRCVVFLYNPFDANVLRQFLEKNRDHFQRRNSILIYVNDVHRGVMPEVGFALMGDRRKATSQWQWKS
jgi:SAM-dependent methyltransferase